jgi:uncharacterized membrane protein
MIPFFVLCSVFALLSLLGVLGVKHFRASGNALRYALAAMFMLTASAHFNHLRGDLIRMVPDVFPAPGLLVTLTGIVEIAGAVGLLVSRFVRPAAVGLSLLLLCVFPANAYAAGAGLTLGGEAVMALLPRALLQLVFIAATVACAIYFRPKSGQAAREPKAGF